MNVCCLLTEIKYCILLLSEVDQEWHHGYLGCFKHVNGRTVVLDQFVYVNETSMSVELCRATCRGYNTPFAGIDVSIIMYI